MNITASVIFYRSCAALKGRLLRKATKSCLGQEMKADIRSRASFLKSRAPGLSCTDPRFHRSMQQHAFLWCISESVHPVLVLGRNHCTGLSIATVMIHCELLPILILVSIEDDKEPLPFLPLGRIYSWPLATLGAFWSLEPQAYLVKTMHQQIIRSHFAVSTCCTLLSTAACWKVHSCENVCPIMCLILTWKCKKDFSSILSYFSRMKEAVGFIATASSDGMIVAIQYTGSNSIGLVAFKWSTFMRPGSMSIFQSLPWCELKESCHKRPA